MSSKLVVLLAAVATMGRLCSAQVGFRTEETRLGRLHDEITWERSVGEYGLHWAYVAKRGDQEVVVVDGREGPAFDGIGYDRSRINPIQCSRQGMRIGYVVRDGERYRVVVDGEAGPAYESVVREAPVFSNSGHHFAYIAEANGKFLVVLDGRAGEPCDAVADTPRFVADTEEFVYLAQHGRNWTLLVDGVARGTYDDTAVGAVCGPGQLLRLGWSPCARHYAFVAATGGQWRLVTDGREGPPYDAVSRPVFSEDGRRVAYGARKGDAWVVVTDGREGPPYDAVSPPVFSEDGRRVAYGARKGDVWVIVVDGEELGQCEPEPTEQMERFAPPFTFSPDGTRLAYIAPQGEQRAIVVDGQKGPAYDSICSCGFSPDGSRFAYEGRIGDSWTLVLDGKPGAPYRDIDYFLWTFSPDSRHFAYVASNEELYPYGEGRVFVVLDSREGSEYAHVEALKFSPDGAHLFYVGVKALGEHTTSPPLAPTPGSSMREPAGMVPDAPPPPLEPPDEEEDMEEEEDMGEEEEMEEELPGLPFTAESPTAADGPTRKWVVVLNGEEIAEYGAPVWAKFSPDGSRFVYVVREPGAQFLVEEGVRGHPYPLIWSLYFSPDAAHLACLVCEPPPGADIDLPMEEMAPTEEPGPRWEPVAKGGRWFFVIDGEKGPAYDCMPLNTAVWSPGNSLEYLAVKQGALYRVKHFPVRG